VNAVADRLARPSVAYLSIAAIYALAAVLRFTSYLNHDSSWLLLATRRMLDGAGLYTDILEVNPPLILWLNVPPVLVSEATGITAENAFLIAVFALSAISLLILAGVTRHIDGLRASESHVLLIAAAAALLVVPGYDFGQREHLMLVFALPYVLLAGARAGDARPPTALAFAVGGFAALGFCLKPYFFLIPVALELFVLVRSRSLKRCFRAENLAIAGVALAYAGTLLWLAPGYIEIMVPLALEIYNQTYTGDPLYVFRQTAQVLLIAGLAAIYLFCLHGARLNVLIALLIATVAQVVIFAAQGKGWHYQLVPALGFLTVALAFCAVATAGMAKRQTGSALIGAARPPLAIAILFALLASTLPQQRYTGEFQDIATALDRLGLSPDSYFSFSAHVFHSFPLGAAAGMSYASQAPAQWLMPGIAIREAQARTDPESWTPMMDTIRDLARNSVLEDFERNRPELVVVHDSPAKNYFQGLPFDYIEWFSKDPRFAAIWSDYEKIGSVDAAHVALYRRRIGDEDTAATAASTQSAAPMN
jgi:hypothetical protein